MLEWVKFLVETEKKYCKDPLPQWEEMVNTALYAVLDILPADSLISKIDNDDKWFISHRNLVSITVNHFRELKRMFSAAQEVGSSDWWQSYNKLSTKLNRGVPAKLELKLCTSTALFEKCGHTYPCSNKLRRESEKVPVYCDLCEKENDTTKGNFFLL